MNKSNLNKEFREDAIGEYENQVATYHDTLQQYSDSIVYIESIYPKQGMPQYGIEYNDDFVGRGLHHVKTDKIIKSTYDAYSVIPKSIIQRYRKEWLL